MEEDFILNMIPCEYSKRMKCDSLYIERYNKLLKKIHEVILYAEENCSEQNVDNIKYILGIE